MNKVLLYYDVVSPWSFMAWEIIKRYQKPWSLDVELRPIFLGGVMHASGNKPPVTVPNKGAHQAMDIQRICEYYKIPMRMKTDGSFPPNTMASMRFLRTVQDVRPDLLMPVTQAFWSCIFGGGQADATSPADFAKLLGPVKGLDADEIATLIKQSTSPENKERVKQEATELAKNGAFGAPWIVVTRASDGTSAPFFGSDRFEIIGWFIGKTWEGPFPKSGGAKL